MNRKPTKKNEEIKEGDYVNAAACTVDKTAATAGQKFLCFTQCFAPVAACWLTLLVIMTLRIYFTSVMSEKISKLTAESQQLNTLMELLNMSTDNQSTLNDLMEQIRSKITNLTADNQNLKTQNQNLETQRDNLTEKLKDMETEWKELNVSRAQWSIDAYCRQHGKGQCQPCQGGWLHSLYSCYGINNPPSAGQKTWTEARENCKGKISDLAVIVNEQEKTFIKENSWDSSGNRGYWIGLRVEDGKWKWADGSDLNETSWAPPPTNGHCAISVEDAGWNSVSCSDRNRWFCQQKALSV